MSEKYDYSMSFLFFILSIIPFVCLQFTKYVKDILIFDWLIVWCLQAYISPTSTHGLLELAADWRVVMVPVTAAHYPLLLMFNHKIYSPPIIQFSTPLSHTPMISKLWFISHST